MNKTSSDSIVIVGGGLGGLASACTLAARGYSVTLLEANAWLGGKAAVHDDLGFRFDMGPTILTMPSVLRRIFGEAGRRLENELDLIRLDPQWRSFFEDGSSLDLMENVADMSRRLDRYSPGSGSGEGYQRFMKFAARLNRITDRYFFYQSVGGLRDMFSLPGTMRAGTLGDVLSMRMGRTVASTIRSFIPDPRVAQMLDHYTQYVGSAPDQSPAVLCGIAQMQSGEGVWYPRGGTAAVPRVLRKLASELGVEIRTGVTVERILTQGRRVSGVRTSDGEVFECGAVVSNADSVRTHRELLSRHDAVPAFERRRNYESACSGVVLYLGLRKRYDHLAHHNFVFSRDPHEEFDFIYRRGEPAPDPTAYVCAPAATDADVAPAGAEALYVLVHTPHLRPHHDWKQMLPSYRKTILTKLKTAGGLEDIEERIVTERILTPQDIHDRYRVLNGAIYGLASHGRFLGAFKPSNRSPDVRGLYLAGGSAHPGPGMPMALMSGWIAADALDQDAIVDRVENASPSFTPLEEELSIA